MGRLHLEPDAPPKVEQFGKPGGSRADNSSPSGSCVNQCTTKRSARRARWRRQSDRVEAVRCGQIVTVEASVGSAVDVAAEQESRTGPTSACELFIQSRFWTDVLGHDAPIECLRGLGAPTKSPNEVCIRFSERRDREPSSQTTSIATAYCSRAGRVCLPCDLVRCELPITAAGATQVMSTRRE